MSVRCPKCRKKHDEPYPKRCGCGQSLVAVLATRRPEAEQPEATTKAAWVSPDLRWTAPPAVMQALRADGAFERTENEW